MVMENPSPQCVGLEFVRQYYTVLNKAPMHLHRFYSNNSLFMHGGPNSVNDPTVGQGDIHKKILSLNFQDCHAKIRMVDAHETLENGVVIQVSGELSNNGMPMRRFMQTFVLAPQTVKKYYVHNDIFRYQDEVFSDEEVGEDGSSDPEEELESCSPGIVESNYSVNNNSSTTVNGTSSHHSHSHHREQDLASPVPTSAASPPTHIPSPPQVTPTPTCTPLTPPVQAPATSTTATSNTSVNSLPVEPQPTTPPIPEDDWGVTNQSEDWADAMEVPVAQSPPKETPMVKSPSAAEPSPVVVSQSLSNEPKTFANLFKTSSNSFAPTSAPNPPVQNEQPTHSTPSYSSQSARPEPPSNRSNGPSGGPPQGPSQSQGTGNNIRLSRNFYDDEKRRPAVPDSQQVFVGNLPHCVGEDQLRHEFTQYGKILEIRINTGKGKTGAKGPGHPVPNFGFIAFEEEEAVVRCLSSRPIYLNGESRINVEEKKARSRVESTGGMGGRPNSGGRGGMGGSGMRGGIMQGGRGGGGGRGGFNRDTRGGGGGSRGGGYMPRR